MIIVANDRSVGKVTAPLLPEMIVWSKELVLVTGDSPGVNVKVWPFEVIVLAVVRPVGTVMAPLVPEMSVCPSELTVVT